MGWNQSWRNILIFMQNKISYWYVIVILSNNYSVKPLSTFLPLILLVIGTVNNASSDLFSTFAHILRCIRLKGIYIEGCYKPLRILKVWSRMVWKKITLIDSTFQSRPISKDLFHASAKKISFLRQAIFHLSTLTYDSNKFNGK